MTQLYYHATSYECAKKIKKSGFKLGEDGMFGGGIYFCDIPINAKAKARNDTVDSIIIVHLDVGRLMTEERAHHGWNLKILNEKGYDSVQMTHCRTGPEICLYEPSRIKIHTIVHWDNDTVEFIGPKTEEVNFLFFNFLISNRKVIFNPPKDIDIDLNNYQDNELKRKLLQGFFVMEEYLYEEEKKNVISTEENVSSNYDKPRICIFSDYLEEKRKLEDEYPDTKDELKQSCERLLLKLKMQKEQDDKRVELGRAAFGDKFEVTPNEDLEEMIEQLECVIHGNDC